jgi:hypothetical protein
MKSDDQVLTPGMVFEISVFITMPTMILILYFCVTCGLLGYDTMFHRKAGKHLHDHVTSQPRHLTPSNLKLYPYIKGTGGSLEVSRAFSWSLTKVNSPWCFISVSTFCDAVLRFNWNLMLGGRVGRGNHTDRTVQKICLFTPVKLKPYLLNPNYNGF